MKSIAVATLALARPPARRSRNRACPRTKSSSAPRRTCPARSPPSPSPLCNGMRLRVDEINAAGRHPTAAS